MGHKSFVEHWAKSACAQIQNNEGVVGFVPLVPLVDPDLTLYEDLNSILLNKVETSHSAKKKLNLGSSSQTFYETGLTETGNTNEHHGLEQEDLMDNFVQQDVSKVLCEGEIVEENEQSRYAEDNNLNCSSIQGTQVILETIIFL